MKNSAPLILAMLGFTMMLIVLPDGVVLSVLAAVEGRHVEELNEQAATVTMAMTMIGLLCLVGGLVGFAVGQRHNQRWGPYEVALARLAMEHGQGVFAQPGGGIGFQSAREGHKLEVRVAPGNPPVLVVRQAVPARQPLVFVKLESELPPAYDHFKPAGERTSWELLAELPALAKAHMNDVDMIERMDHFFSLEESRWIVHDAAGIEVVCELPPPNTVGQRTREALSVLAYLRQVNG